MEIEVSTKVKVNIDGISTKGNVYLCYKTHIFYETRYLAIVESACGGYTTITVDRGLATLHHADCDRDWAIEAALKHLTAEELQSMRQCDAVTVLDTLYDLSRGIEDLLWEDCK